MFDSPASTPRVPAWKRLGLKLKYAKDEAQSPVSTPDNASASKKRSWPTEDHEEGTADHLKKDVTQNKGKSEDKKNKKRKTSQDAAATSDEPATTDKPSKKDKKEKKSEKSKSKEQSSWTSKSKPKPSIVDIAVSTPIKTLKRKKSVSFTPDTKTKDGDQHLVKAWTSSLQQESSSVPSSESAEPATSAVEDADKPSKADLKKAKKEAKRKAKNDAATSTSTAASKAPADAPPFLTYLQLYHADRANWKFNKVKQGALFDNLFKIQRLPASYDGALRAYLEGLKGDAVRQRLLEQAREILEKTKDERPKDANADADSDASSASSSSLSDSTSESSSSGSSSESDSDSESDSGSPTPSTATAAAPADKKTGPKSTKSVARRREERGKDGVSGAKASADQQLLLAQRCRAQMILEVLDPKSVQRVQLGKAPKKREGKRKEKQEIESESSDESSDVSSSSEESSSEDDSSSDDGSSSEDTAIEDQT
ncbi:hypothetical protein IWX49DRAFT_579086 [Phyllosticta citricarpa]|uniref:WKF domain-containing protein n=1 Tax=Phyllosticta citricarpa TaxID=55181 RepID=A0ABR1LVI2_9PEZI